MSVIVAMAVFMLRFVVRVFMLMPFKDRKIRAYYNCANDTEKAAELQSQAKSPGIQMNLFNTGEEK